MELKEIAITLPKWHPKSHYNLLPFGDLQVGSPLFSRPMWDKYVEAVGTAQNAITIGMGDYADHFRPSVQERLTSAVGGYDKDSLVTMQEMHRDFMDRHVLPLLRPVVARSMCLGLLAGHHDMDYGDGTNSTQYLCRKLKVPYLGRGEAMIRVAIRLGGRQGRKQLDFDIYATHGEGKGSSAGNALSKLQRLLANFDVDIMLRGHSCDKFIHQEPWFTMTRTVPPRLRTLNRMVVNTGGFSQPRVEGLDTYVERANLPPKAMGWVEVHIHVRREDNAEGPGRGTHYLVIGD